MSDNELKLIRVIKALKESYDFGITSSKILLRSNLKFNMSLQKRTKMI